MARIFPSIAWVLAGVGVAHVGMVPCAMAAEVVQALPDPNRARLSDALTRLARDQNNLEALLDAGNAACGLGDFEAARSFFERATKIAPGDARIAMGLGRTELRAGDPVAAIGWFEKAERAGGDGVAMASDYGLALDMVGDNTGAQARYVQALTAGDDAQVRQRLAISQAISGNVNASDTTLLPLLKDQDGPAYKSAWRTRAFTLAISGKTREAIDLAGRILPEPLAIEVAPYFRYMPRLTAAQQAAAANLGRFPRASEIGRDSAQIAAYTPSRAPGADQALIPTGAALDTPSKGSAAAQTVRRADADGAGSTSASTARARSGGTTPRDSTRKSTGRDRPAVQTERVAPPEPMPGIESGPDVAASGELPPVTSQTAVAPPKPAPVASKPLPAPSPPVQAAPKASTPAAQAGAAAPGFDLAQVRGSGPAPDARQPATPPPAAPPQPSVADAFSDLGAPSQVNMRQAGAVDMRTVKPARAAPAPVAAATPAAKPAAPPAPRKPAHPSRIWVQIGVSRDKEAIAFEWRRYQRKLPELFKSREPHISEMGRTNRILVGPFESRRAATDFLDAFVKAGDAGAMVWTSPAGQVVDELPSKP